MSTTGLLTTTAGQAAILADLSGGANLVLSHVAFGDANGVPYNPVEAQVALVREKYRCTIAAMGVTAGGLFVDAIIPADTNDALGRLSHGFNIAECGLFSADGTLIGVARMGNGYKPSPNSVNGQASIATYRLILACANPAAISVHIDPQAQVALGRMVRPCWLTIDGVVNDPPVNPASGATYVIGAAPTAAWGGHAGKLAQWIGMWSISIAPEGHVVADASTGIGASTRYLRYSGGMWISAAATDAAYGVSRQATGAEVLARSPVSAYLTPAGLDTLAQLQPVYPEIETAGATLTLTHAAGSLVVGAAGQSWVHRGLRRFTIDAMPAGDRTFATAASKTYHVRWNAPGTGTAVPAANYPNGRFELVDLTGASPAEGDASYDTTFDRMLVARIVTSAGNVATITPLANRAALTGVAAKTATAVDQFSWGNMPGLSATINWARAPQVSIRSFSVDATSGTEGLAGISATATRYTVTGYLSGYVTSGSQSGWYVSGALTLELRA